MSDRGPSWWEAAVVLLAFSSALLGVLFTANGEPGWGVAAGFLPAALLVVGLATRRSLPRLATILLIIGSALAAIAWWPIYTVVLALVVVVGGLVSGKIGVTAPR